MSVALFMDVHVRLEVTRELRRRGVDVLTAQDDGADTLTDAELLERAAVLGRVLVTQDKDLFRETASLLAAGRHFSGLVYAHQVRCTVGSLVQDLELIAKANDPAHMVDHIEYLPF